MANLTDADKVLRNDTGKDIASKLDAIKTAIQNQSTTLNNLADVSILSVQDGQFLKYNSTEQKWENVSLPDPMVFKGTLGTGGTITDLPVDGSANVGDTYKVIEDGTYATVSAKVGDLFSCLTKTSVANTWVLIPSGDESFTDTWRGIKVNGTEKLASSISSGEVDFVEGSNVQITFDTTGNKIIISATDTTYSEATQSASGLMSASDKTKLDTIPNTIPTTADTQPITSGSAVNTKEYIDDKTTLVKSASGSLIHITDGGDNIPMKSLESEIVAVESGSGEKSPTNPYTISGFDSGVVSVCGVNLWDEQWEVGLLDHNTGEKTTGNAIISKNFIPIKSGIDIYCVIPIWFRIAFYDENKTFISGLQVSTRKITMPDNAFYMKFSTNAAYGTTYHNDISINYPSTDTQYHAYNGNTYTFTFGQTVYGGVLDVLSGELTIKKAYTRADSLSWDKNHPSPTQWLYYSRSLLDVVKASGVCVCSHCQSVSEPPMYTIGANINANGVCYLNFSDAIGTNDLASFNAYITNNNVQLVYELATPIVVQLTPTEVKTLLGENNIFSNCGDLDIEYFTSSADGLAALIEVLSNS